MSFDRNGFADWLRQQGRKAAPDKYPASLDNVENTGPLSIDSYVPNRTTELLSLLEYPGMGQFRGEELSILRDWRCCVNRYDDYIRQRDKLPPRLGRRSH